MTCPASTIGDNGRRPLHHWLPVGVGHVGHQDVARLHAVHFRRPFDQPDLPLPDLLPDGTAGGQYRGLAAKLVFCLCAFAQLRLHGLGPGLQDVDLPVPPVAAPFDVHRAPVMALDDQRKARQFLDFGVGKREPAALRRRHVDRGHRLARGLAAGKDHLDGLFTQCAAQDRRPAGEDIGLVDIEFVGVDGALDDSLAQAIRRGDEHSLVESRFRVEGEQHTRRTQIAAHHPLYARGQCDVRMHKPLVDAVGDGAIIVERGKYFIYSMKYIRQSIDIKECFLLSRKRGVGEVLGRCR